VLLHATAASWGNFEREAATALQRASSELDISDASSERILSLVQARFGTASIKSPEGGSSPRPSASVGYAIPVSSRGLVRAMLARWAGGAQPPALFLGSVVSLSFQDRPQIARERAGSRTYPLFDSPRCCSNAVCRCLIRTQPSNGLVKKQIAPPLSARSRTFSSGKALTKINGTR
jgi:hypothetical protein